MYEESKDRIINLTDRLERLQLEQDRIAAENRMLIDEKRNLDSRLNKTESELNVCEMTKEHLRNDKSIVSNTFAVDAYVFSELPIVLTVVVFFQFDNIKYIMLTK